MAYYFKNDSVTGHDAWERAGAERKKIHRDRATRERRIRGRRCGRDVRHTRIVG